MKTVVLRKPSNCSLHHVILVVLFSHALYILKICSTVVIVKGWKNDKKNHLHFIPRGPHSVFYVSCNRCTSISRFTHERLSHTWTLVLRVNPWPHLFISTGETEQQKPTASSSHKCYIYMPLIHELQCSL